MRLRSRSRPGAPTPKTAALLHQTREQVLLTLNVVLTNAKGNGEAGEGTGVGAAKLRLKTGTDLAPTFSELLPAQVDKLAIQLWAGALQE